MALSIDLIAGALSFLFTLLILSYVIGDNPLFRIAVYLFIGISAGYIASVAFWQVIIPRLVYPILFGTPTDKMFAAVPLAGSLLILLKVSSRLSGMARAAMAFIVGASAAVVIAGALSGTLIPQFMGTINSFDLARAGSANAFETLFTGAIILAGTVFTLIYFHYGAQPQEDGSTKRSTLIKIPAFIGSIFIAITLGVIFAGVYSAALTALIERISSLINFFGNF